jgi:hypothetical protein
VYNPKQKISEIKHTQTYKTPAGTEISRTEREVWNWSGKVLSYIDYYDANDNRTTTLFRYDKDNRIVEINYGDATAKFDYDDNLIDEIEVINGNGVVVEKFDLEHKGNTVTAIDATFNGGKSLTSLPFNPLSLFIPESAANKVMEGSQTKGTTHVVLTWTGKNVTAVEISGTTNQSFRWTYDDKINPYKGLFDIEGIGLDATFSANNVVREEITEAGSTKATNYSFVYDKKNCPSTKTWESTMNFEDIIDLPVTCVDEYKY